MSGKAAKASKKMDSRVARTRDVLGDAMIALMLPRARGIAPERRAAVAHAFAGAMFSMLEWWVDRQERPSPAEMDALFHKLVWSGITAHLYTSEI